MRLQPKNAHDIKNRIILNWRLKERLKMLKNTSG